LEHVDEQLFNQVRVEWHAVRLANPFNAAIGDQFDEYEVPSP